MSDDEPDDESLAARLRWLAERVSRSVEDLGELDLNLIARVTGLDADRARELLTNAGQWLGQSDDIVGEVVSRFGGLFGAAAGAPAEPADGRPHPLDLPTPGQGLALSAIDSGRWTVEPGSHVLLANGEGPAPSDAVGLVGELRARDWIGGDGELTLVGRSALKRWADGPGAG